MRNKHIVSLLVSLLLSFVSCDKEETRLVDFLVEFATISKTESSIKFILDNGDVLIPKSITSLKGEDGERVIINYTPLENGFININSFSKIFVDTIKEEGFPEKLETSPIKIISVWVKGNYLNMSFQIDYHSKTHSVALFRDTKANKPTLYFGYSRRDDPPGAPTLKYLSFNLESLKKEDFAIYINTYEGVRKFDFKLK